MLTGNALAVYNLFLKHIKLTDVQISKLININPNSVRATRLKLEQMKLISRTEKKKKMSYGMANNKHDGMYTIYQLEKVIDPKKIKNKKKKKKFSISELRSKLKILQKTVKSMLKELQ